ncbi:hypothetical protein C1T31_00915 [Hanstruepera neustonica]|uniref:Outer membrane protein beta-barrel domain-containing protein n=1 Tax=Hanstruepera neustonica TaxID=1445657 RepID=A0A2K1E366_9FLAO|nr:hypothetical protein [Hanstruepera neustonica]PNQ74734.1 hypothetical protein C1T31_00915 [Hanstruepera neustonica]
MSDKKHIDRIFQEKLKDFEVSPKPELWDNIQSKLNLEKDEPKKIIPIWMRIVGIAALLALLFTIGSFVFNSADLISSEPNQNTVDTNSQEPFNENSQNSQTDKDNQSTKSGNENDHSVEDNLDSQLAPSFSTDKESIANSSKESVASDMVDYEDEITNDSPSTNSNQNGSSLNSFSKSDVAVSKSEAGKNNIENSSNSTVNNHSVEISQLEKSSKNAVVSNSTNATDNYLDKGTQEATDNNQKNKTTSNNLEILNSKNNPQVSSSVNKANSAVAQSNSNPELDKNAVENALELEKTQEAVVFNAMENDTPHNEKEKEDNQKVGDSLAASELPSIEEEIAQLDNISEKEEEKEELVNRWQVAANIAPVYYNSLGKGSHIDEQFVSNSKSGEVNTSYGVNVSYALSKKLSVRSGVNSLNLSYDTDNVILYETPNSNTNNPNTNPLRNINLAPQSQSLNAFSADNLGVQQVFDELYNAAISQRLSYYEVPVELEYKLVNNRFGFNIIGGVSTFFLDGNEVYSEFEEYKTYIGEANNVNNVSFSTNLGIGINYKFSETFKFNLEPTFKYQLNGFENTSGNFRPYIIGVYTGFSYKF